MLNLNKHYPYLVWPIILIVIYAMAMLRPIHQDDGWYASFALRYLADLSFFDNPSFFSYSDSNGGNDSPGGFLFSSLQSLFSALFGFSINSVRILNALSITIILALVHQIISFQFPRIRWWITAVLLFNPVFYYHFYNRPETVAAALMLVSIWLLLSKGNDNKMVFLAYFIWALILDTHPIAIFGVVGLGCWFWIKNLNKSLYVVSGGLSGLSVILILNQLINGNLGLFAGLAGQVPVNFGDHYVPLLESDFTDYLRIAKERFNTIKSFLLLSGIVILVPLVIYAQKGVGFLRHPLVINYLFFIFFATIGTEAYSNGFALYSIISLLLLYAAFIESWPRLLGFKYWFILFIPLIGWSLKSTASSLVSYYAYQKNFDDKYQEFGDCIDQNAKILMRPTFVFATADKGLHSDYFYGILQVMLDNQMSFDQALILRDYDYIVLDDRNLNEDLFIDKRDEKQFDNPAYSKYRTIGISSSDFQVLIQNRFLEPVCEFEEISHGKSILYKVNKP